jgi:hypothetical protein
MQRPLVRMGKVPDIDALNESGEHAIIEWERRGW